jgi:hypothetical protein
MAAGFGRIAQRVVGTMFELLAPIAKRELAKVYGSQPPMWRPLARRIDPTYFGRKRRARRARGRKRELKWIEKMVILDSLRKGLRAAAAQQLPTFADPSLGEPWEAQSDD